MLDRELSCRTWLHSPDEQVRHFEGPRRKGGPGASALALEDAAEGRALTWDVDGVITREGVVA